MFPRLLHIDGTIAKDDTGQGTYGMLTSHQKRKW